MQFNFFRIEIFCVKLILIYENDWIWINVFMDELQWQLVYEVDLLAKKDRQVLRERTRKINK